MFAGAIISADEMRETGNELEALKYLLKDRAMILCTD